MRTTRLSELVQQGRLVMHSGGAAAAPKVQPRPPAALSARSRPRVGEDIVDSIELLAIQLLSISKSSKSDPEALMREALLSIDECITSIASRH